MTPDPTPSDLARLREIAEAATPGPWEASECLDVWVSTPDTDDADGIPVAQTGDIHWIGKQGMTEASMKSNGDFIATFDPPTVLALLTARQEAEARAEAAERENCKLADRALAEARRATALEARAETLRERLQAIVDWANFALSNPAEFDSHGVRNLDGPVFDEARAALAPHAEKEEADHG